jgi:hypothetical protein
LDMYNKLFNSDQNYQTNMIHMNRFQCKKHYRLIENLRYIYSMENF